MSYCHLLAGCGYTQVFHPQSINFGVSARIDSALNQCVFPPAAGAAPVVAGITPGAGPPSGGTAVTITGSSFRDPVKVAFTDAGGSSTATSVVVLSPTTITAITPAETAGPKTVVVTNPDLQVGALTGGFRYEGAAVAQVSPNRGPIAGGVPITITGAQLAGPASVSLGGTPATAVEVANSTTMTAVTPPHAPGQVDVVVTLPGGATAELAGGFLYQAPAPPAAFYTLTPCRTIDTRTPPGPSGSPALAPGARRNFVVTYCRVPGTAKAISVNVTVTGATAPGFVSLFPGDGSLPPSSTINFSAGQTRANDAVVPLAADGTGSMAVFNGAASPVHFIVDVNGYFE
jgi:hypothetical protein